MYFGVDENLFSLLTRVLTKILPTYKFIQNYFKYENTNKITIENILSMQGENASSGQSFGL